MDDNHFSVNETLDLVTFLFRSRMRYFGRNEVSMHFASTENDGYTLYDNFHPVGSIGYKPISVIIGVCDLVCNKSGDDFVSDSDVVDTVFKMYHECMHVWQYSVGYRRKDASDVVKCAARNYVIGSFIPEYRKSAYLYDASELSADAYVMEQTKRCFEALSMSDSRFSDIDVDSIILARERGRRKNMTRVLDRCESIDDAVAVYKLSAVSFQYRHKFPIQQIEDIVPKKQRSKGFKEILRNEKLCDSLLNSSSGLEETELLCHYIGEYHPEHFRGLLCIRDEYCHDAGSRAMSKLLRVTEAEPVEPGPDGPEIL